MDPLQSALREVEERLGRYPAPRTEPCGCEACQEESQRILQGMRNAPREVSREKVHAAIWSAYTTWCADWSELAHFVLAALWILERNTAFESYLALDQEMLFRKLLVSARPDMEPDFAPLAPMPAEDRQAIFKAVAALLLHHAAAPDGTMLDEHLTWTLGFLAQFDGPILPVLEAWQDDPRSLARARLCSVMAACALHNTGRPFFGNSYLDGAYRPLPENEGAMTAAFSLANIARYLMDHTEDFSALTEEEAQALNDGWYAAAQATEWANAPEPTTGNRTEGTTRKPPT